jgi:ribonuclease HI
VSPIRIYTDGGCSGNPGPGAWAFILLAGQQRLQGSAGERETTNNRMELQAVIASLEELGRHAEWRGRPVELFTDSQYVHRGISEWVHAWTRNGWRTKARQPVKNQDLWQRLLALSAGIPVDWRWLQGHAGQPLNEECDRLVQAAIRKLRS